MLELQRVGQNCLRIVWGNRSLACRPAEASHRSLRIHRMPQLFRYVAAAAASQKNEARSEVVVGGPAPGHILERTINTLLLLRDASIGLRWPFRPWMSI